MNRSGRIQAAENLMNDIPSNELNLLNPPESLNLITDFAPCELSLINPPESLNSSRNPSIFSPKSSQPSHRLINLLKNQSLREKAQKHLRKNSKFPIKSAIIAKNFKAAIELKEKGFLIPPTLIFDSIFKHDEENTIQIISNNLYSNENIELVFWTLLSSGFLIAAKNLWQNEPETLKPFSEISDFDSNAGANLVTSNRELMSIAFEQAVIFGVDSIACALLKSDYKLLTISRLNAALESGCVNLLKIVWSGDLLTYPAEITEQLLQSELWEYLEERFSDVEDVKDMRIFMKASNLIEFYLNAERYHEARQIVSWTVLKNSAKVLKMLIESSSSQLACEFIKKTELRITTNQLTLALMEKQYDVCYVMLRIIKTPLEMASKELQNELIELLGKSESCLLAAEILNRLSLRVWDLENTRGLCLVLMDFAKKRQEVLYCTNPILFCVIVASVMDKMAKNSRRYRNRCENVKDLYISLGVSMQEHITDESALKYYLTEKDSTGKTALEIIAHRKFYQLLENNDVGILVTKLWIGSANFYGFNVASSIVNSVLAPAGSEESMQFAKGIDETQPYEFQLVRWRESCSSRFANFGYSILMLIILYQILLYNMVNNQSFLNMSNNGYEVKLFGAIVALIFGISCEQILAIMFSLKTRGKVDIDMWKINDWIISLLVIFISLEVPRRVYENGTVTFNSAYLGSGIVHSIMLGLITLKLWRYLMTSQRFGKFLSMILLVFKEIFTFFVIFAGFMICSAAIFTLLFRATYGYNDLSQSLRTLVEATIGPFVINAFMQDRDAFGAIMLSIFLLIAHILLLNLLIGIVNNVFNSFQTKISSEYRSELIETYYENQWSDSCGILILVPTPLNALTLLFSPLVLLPNSEKWNHRLTKILFSVYVLPYFIGFVVFSLAAIPVAYLQGFLIYGRTGRTVALEKPIKIFDIPDEEEVTYVIKFSFLKSLFWTFIGPFWLLFAFFRDCFTFWKIAYLDTPASETNNSIINLVFIVNFQKALQEFGDTVVTVDEFYKAFKKYDIVVNKDSEERENECLMVLEWFSNPLVDKKIECSRIREVFPKMKEANYDEEYVKRFSNYRLQFLCKGIVGFQRKIGSFRALKKMKMSKGEGLHVFEEEIGKVECYAIELKGKVKELLEETRVIIGSKLLEDSSEEEEL